MKKFNSILKRAAAFIISAAMIHVSGIIPTAYAAESVTVVLDPANASPFNDGRFEGWGTSLCWWANRVGYSDKMTQQAAELFFSEDGLGLDIARYNVGGGDDPAHTHITRSDSKVPGYATGFDDSGNLIYDWTADQNQRNIAIAAKAANSDLYFEGFSNSPPYFMTNSGCSSGSVDKITDNLKSDQYDNFAKYIADVTKHFKDEWGIEFESYSPMNEPDTNYWGANSNKQEGCHYDPGASQSKMIVATRAALDNAGLNDVIVAGMDETSIDSSVKNLDKLTDEAKNALGRIDTHSYSGSKRAQLKDKAVSMNKTLWMSEVDQGGKAGVNAGNMSMGLNLANNILADMNGMQPAAWVMWDIVDKHKDSKFSGEEEAFLDQNGTLWGVGMANHDTETIELTQKYYVFGQFTKYINPGDTIIASSDRTLAAYNKDTGAVKIVAVNDSGSAKDYTFDMSAFSKTGTKAKVIRTSGAFNGGENWAELEDADVADKMFNYELPANSVTTFVVEQDNPLSISKFQKLPDETGGIEYSFSVPREFDAYNKYFAIYDKDNNLKAVTVNQPNGIIEGDFEDCVPKLMVWDGMNPMADAISDITENNDSIGYITINGSKLVINGNEYTYTSQTSDGSSVSWSVSDETVAAIDNSGKLTPLKGGKITVTASSETMGSNSMTVIVSDAAKIALTEDDVSGSKSWNNVESTSVKKLVDGNFNTYFDGLNAGYAVFDLGAAHNISMIGYAPRAGYEYRMIDGKFSGSNDYTNWAELYEIKQDPSSGKFTYIMEDALKNADKAYRYIKYEIPSGKQSYNGKEEDYNCNIAEVEIYGIKDENAVSMAIKGKDTLQRKETAQYTVEISGAEADDIEWSVSDNTVAEISADGTVTAKAIGETVIFAKSSSLGITASKNISVEWAKLVPVQTSGSAPYNNNSANDHTKALDGNTATFFDGLADGYILLDFGNPYSIEMIGYAARANHEKRMPGVQFLASEDGENWTELYSFSSQPPGGLQYLDKSSLKNVDDKSYRYVKCLGKDYCNIAEFEVYGEAAELNDKQIVEAAAEKVDIDSEIYGNIYLPTEINGVSVEWSVSENAFISADGNVTRGEEDCEVILTAVFTKGEETLEKKYNVTVKAAASGKTEDDMAAYLFVHFVGTESSADCEQIYFSVSKDGSTWNTLNESMPILTSNLGEKGVRDPHIVRSPEGDKFFLIATDLSIYNRRGDSDRWANCQKSGSKSIVVWESNDLVNWSEARLVKAAPDNAGCAWAPESVYDDESGRYMVFWASKTADDDYATQRIYRCYTRDFKNFTEPELYIDGGNISNIDTSIIKDNGTYYRFTKNESKSSIIMEKSDSLNGPFTAVDGYKINGTDGNTVTGYEGPTAYKINGEDKWCLLLDYYSKSQGYKPFMTSDLSTGEFTSAGDFNFDMTYRHGCVMPITQEEYDNLIKEYMPVDEEETGEVILSLDFDNETAEASLGAAKVNGEIAYTDGFSGKAAVLDGSDYIELTKSDNTPLLAGLDTFTVSFAVKADGQSWWFYTAPNASAQTYQSEKYIGVLDSGSKFTCERYNSSSQERPAAAVGNHDNQWSYITLVHRKKSYTLYINGEEISRVATAVDLKTLLGDNPIAYIGKANWGTGEYSSGAIDEFKVYNYALSAEEVKASYAEYSK